MAKTILAGFECISLFLVLPLIIAADFVQMPVLLILAFLSIPAGIWLYQAAPREIHPNWRFGGDQQLERRHLKRMLLRFLPCSITMMALVAIFWPTRLFSLPWQAPLLWMAIVLLYPLISVFPQELLCRAYFFFRYGRLFPGRYLMILGSAAAFAAIHLVYGNLPALVLSGIGGIFFADTYARTSSFRLVWLEHSLYGITIFTVGLGSFFDKQDSTLLNISSLVG